MMIVEQFGLAIRPLCLWICSGFTSGTTSGTPSFMRKADVLSITTAPALTALGANSFEIDPPALKYATCTSSKLSWVSSSIVYACPRNVAVLPALRAEARSLRFLIGKFRSARTVSSSWPTAPVAPTMATFTADISDRSRKTDRPQAKLESTRDSQPHEPTSAKQGAACPVYFVAVVVRVVVVVVVIGCLPVALHVRCRRGFRAAAGDGALSWMYEADSSDGAEMA